MPTLSPESPAHTKVEADANASAFYVCIMTKNRKT